jgi:hypothetical protein
MIIRTLFIGIIVFFIACDSSNDDIFSPNNNTPASGQWKVTYFFDKNDETSYYTNYTFEFNSDGTLKAQNGNQTWSGNWKSGYDDSANKFLIDFNGGINSQLEELEEDWRIVTMTDDLMHFEHVSGGNGDTDILKFER